MIPNKTRLTQEERNSFQDQFAQGWMFEGDEFLVRKHMAEGLLRYELTVKFLEKRVESMQRRLSHGKR